MEHDKNTVYRGTIRISGVDPAKAEERDFAVVFSPYGKVPFFVNSELGNDATGDGSTARPFKTLRHALDQAMGMGQA